MNKKLHQANPLKLDVLNMTHIVKQKIKDMRLLQFDFTSPVTKDEFMKKHKFLSGQVVKAL